MRKTHLYFIAATLLFLSVKGYSQSAAINEDGSLPNPNALLDIKSADKGVLIPRLSSTARLAIPNTMGLLVYDTTTHLFWFNNGMVWQNLSAAPGWSLSGNSGLTNQHFLGTTDNRRLLFRVNNQLAGRIDQAHSNDSATTINQNTFWGYNAGASTPFNSAPGAQVYESRRNIAFGHAALYSNTIGYSNVASGAFSLHFNTSGFNNTASGYCAMYSNVFGFNNSAYGAYALYSNKSGQENTATGTYALYSNTFAHSNTATGFSAMYSNTTGTSNTATGAYALYSNINGNQNTATGAHSMRSNTSGSENTATGHNSLQANTTGTRNTAIGSAALFSNTTGISNSAGGAHALNSNVSGSSNTAFGSHAMFRTATGGFNTAFGGNALDSNLSGSFNTAIGYAALHNNKTGGNNTAIGALADVSNPNLTNATAIGFGAVVNASNKVRIGNAAVTVIEGTVPFTTPSDGRFKFDVREDVKGLDFILQLRPVSYNFDIKEFDARHGTGTLADSREAAALRHNGFIAQEVEKAAIASGYTFSGIVKPKTEGEYYSLSYESFVVPLVKAVQEQQQVMDAQSKKMDEQDRKMTELLQQLKVIKKSGK